MAKHKIEDLRAEADENGWQLISETYQNLDTDLEYKCEKGHTVYSPYKKIRSKGYCCPICSEFNGYTDMDIATRPISKSKDTYRILALDQSSKVTGFSIFDNDVLIKYGAIEIKGDKAPIRFSKLREWIRNMIVSWKPDFIVIEDIQLEDNERNGTKNVVTYKILAGLIGVLETFFTDIDVPYELAHVSTWRNSQQVTGRSRSDKKRSSQLKVKKCYDVDVTDDEADAILIGRYSVEKRKEKIEEDKVICWE